MGGGRKGKDEEGEKVKRRWRRGDVGGGYG